MTAGGSISGFNIPISESSNAIAPSYSYRISTNSAFSFSIRNPSPILIAFNLSGVNRDPRGTHFPSFPSKPVSQVTLPSGLIPSGSGVFAGKTLIPFLLYNVLTCRTTFLNSFLVNRNIMTNTQTRTSNLLVIPKTVDVPLDILVDREVQAVECPFRHDIDFGSVIKQGFDLDRVIDCRFYPARRTSIKGCFAGNI